MALSGHNYGNYYDWSQNQRSSHPVPRSQAQQSGYSSATTSYSQHGPTHNSTQSGSWYLSSTQHSPTYGTYMNPDNQSQPRPRSTYDDRSSYGNAQSSFGPIANNSHGSNVEDSRMNYGSSYSQSQVPRQSYSDQQTPSYGALTNQPVMQQRRIDRTSSPASNSAHNHQVQTGAEHATRLYQYQQQYNHTQQQHLSPSMMSASKPQSHPQAQVQTTQHTPSSTLRRDGNMSPQGHSRNTSAQYAATPATVNPSEVYDASHEYERHRQMREAQHAHNKSSSTAENPSTTQQDRQEVTTTSTEANTGKSRASNKSGSSKKKKSSKQSQEEESAADREAAATLVQTANSTETSGDAALEAEMRSMFRTMRHFHTLDPKMLARLWEQEHNSFLANETPAPANDAVESVKEKPSKATKPKSSQPKKKEQAAKTNDNVTQNAKSNNTVTQTINTVKDTPPQPASSGSKQAHAGQTFWPANRKAELSAAAAKYLRNANPARDIQVSEIMQILDSNPNYVELCESFEKKGLNLVRGQLAKTLLAAVPDINQNNKATTSNVNNAPMNGVNQKEASSTSSMAQANVQNAFSETERQLMSAEKLISPKSASKKGGRSKEDTKASQIGKTDVNSSPSKIFAGGKTPIDPQLEGLDAVKQFLDGQSNGASSTGKAKDASHEAKPQVKPQPPVSLAPQTKEEMARKRTFGDLVDLTQLSDEEEDTVPPSKRQELGGTSIVDWSFNPQSTMGSANGDIKAEKFPSPVSGVANQAPKGPVPASQMAPVTQPLQNPTTQRVKEPTSFGHSLPPIPHDHPLHAVVLVQPIDRWKAIRRSTYNPRTIARDVLLATGRHPDLRHLNKHLETLKQAFPWVDNNSDLGTFRWDVVDPGGPPPGAGAIQSPEKDVDTRDYADDEGDGSDSVFDESTSIGQSRSLQGVVVTASTGDTPGDIKSMHRTKDGKPLRKIIKSGSSIRAAKAKNFDAEEIPRGLDKSKGADANASGYAALWAAQGDGVKKKGRPVGWRKWMQKGGGAPGKTSKPNVKSKEPEPEYQVYKCEWKDCAAELHNLATLRKHIHKLHRNEAHECKWNGCGKAKTVTDPATSSTSARFVTLRFKDEETWKAHIETTHLLPVAWRLGDGPAGGISDHHDSELSEAYMSDSHGRRVTPRIVIDEENQDSGTVSDKRTAEAKAKDVEKDAERRKRNIGPGMDKGGARLANDKRRQGFIDDDDSVEIIDDND